MDAGKLYVTERHPLYGMEKSYNNNIKLREHIYKQTEERNLIFVGGRDCPELMYIKLDELAKLISEQVHNQLKGENDV
jgi:hypothetical protein